MHKKDEPFPVKKRGSASHSHATFICTRRIIISSLTIKEDLNNYRVDLNNSP